MVFILYKIRDSDFKVIGAYELEEDAATDKKNLILDTPMEEQDHYKYEILDIHYFKQTQEPLMKFSEEDTDVEEEDYYTLMAKSKHQTEEIILLKGELVSIKNNHMKLITELRNDSYTFIIIISSILLFLIVATISLS
uniref:Uncharacterized protein n=1 Tax=viral metagenome TaxID=1070528 RepID=A0A6C0D5M7_9ZZZZ